MKTLHTLSAALLFAGLISLASSETASAQVQAGKKYRVIAYKSGQPHITSVSNEVIIVPAMSIYVPNTFTPNGDGLNDTFGVAGEAIEDFRMQVFNRWGQLVFESKNAMDRWDGTHMGDPVPMGTYVYKITAATAKGGRQLKEGQVNVIL